MGINLSWYFSHDYYDGLDYSKGNFEINPTNSFDDIDKRNQTIRQVTSDIKCISVPGESHFDLTVEYPGLLVGIGYQHSAGITGEIGLGFSLDYVTGLPYLPGSSVKGTLRSAFRHKDYIRELLNNPDINVDNLEKSIFENNDVFLDAFPYNKSESGQIFELDAITPHHTSEFGELEAPNPLTLLKVRPGTVMRFRFILQDDEGGLNKDNKLSLFKQILLDLGAGAKTNVGFGRFAE